MSVDDLKNSVGLQFELSTWCRNIASSSDLGNHPTGEGLNLTWISPSRLIAERMVTTRWSKVMEVDAAVRTEPPELLRAAMVRTARCLMDGQVRGGELQVADLPQPMHHSPARGCSPRGCQPTTCNRLRRLCEPSFFWVISIAAQKSHLSTLVHSLAHSKLPSYIVDYSVCVCRLRSPEHVFFQIQMHSNRNGRIFTLRLCFETLIVHRLV